MPIRRSFPCVGANVFLLFAVHVHGYHVTARYTQNKLAKTHHEHRWTLLWNPIDINIRSLHSTSCVLRRCSARLEQLAIQRHCVTDTRHLQASVEDTSFRCFPYLTDLYWTCAAQFFFCNVDWCTVFLKFFYLTTL